MITHGNITTGIAYQQVALGLCSESRVFDFASYAFDVAWCNFFHALTSGGCLCIPSESQRRNNMEGSFTALKANYAHITPTLLRCLDFTKMDAIKVLNLSGEAVLGTDIALVPTHIKMVNAYGPAETNVVTIHDFARSLEGPDNAKVAIGRGAGVCTWVVDADSGTDLVKIGDIGELWIEGPLVGSGYLGDDEKTAASFIKDPEWLLRGNSDEHGRRGTLYRTGDLVFYNKDGTLVYVGRKDTQVKISGQRVELGEIEHQLGLALAKLGVSNAKIVVELTRPKLMDRSVLTAFISINYGKTAVNGDDTDALRRVVAQLPEMLTHTLPSYMVPTAYIPVGDMPQTVSGKTDRRRLRDSVASMTLQECQAWSPDSSRSQRPPRTSQEKVMQSLWAKVLSIAPEDISTEDNFFRIGGDSIGAMRLVSLARDVGVSLTVGNIFQHPVLHSLADVGETQIATAGDVVAPFSLLPNGTCIQEFQELAASQCRVPKDKVLDILPCTPLQSSLMERTLSADNMSGFASSHIMKLHERIDLAKFRRAWEELVSRVAILRTRIVRIGCHGWMQVELDHHMEWTCYKTLNALQDKLLDNETMKPGRELVRFGIVNPENDESKYFVLHLHWAAYDGWALRMLLAEAERIYHDSTHNGSLEDMKSFVKYIGNIDESQATNFWKNQFAGIKDSHFPRHQLVMASAKYPPGRYNDVHMAAHETHSEQKDFTAATVVRAALALVIANTIDSDEATFGATVTGRQASVGGIERVAGPTFATLPIRVSIDRKTSLRALLTSVQNQAADMIPFEQVSLAQIGRASSDAATACSFQTLLVIQSGIREGDIRHHRGTAGDGSSDQGMFAHDLTASKGAIVELGQRTGEYPIYVECKLGTQITNHISLRVCVDSDVVSIESAEQLAQALFAAIQGLGCMSNLDLELRDIQF
jgi:aryl carrier-like protein